MLEGFAKAEREFFAQFTTLAPRIERGALAPALVLEQGGQQMRFVRE